MNLSSVQIQFIITLFSASYNVFAIIIYER